MQNKSDQKNKNDVTIIIPVYNGADDLHRCLSALCDQTQEADVIVVDDGSDETDAEKTEDHVGRFAHDGIRSLTLIKHETNRGFAAAVNTGIRAANTPYVILLNNDAFAAPAFTEHLLRAIRRRKNAFAVQALLVQDGTDRIDSAGDYFCAFGWAFSAHRDRETSAARRARVMSACAGAAVYDRARLLALSLFDEAHFCYLEDVDIGLRALRAGFYSYIEPQAVVYHKASATSGSRYNAFKTRLVTANSLYTVSKNLPAWMIVLFFPLLAAGVCIKGVFYTRRGFSAAFLQGLREGAQKIAAYGKNGRPYARKADIRRDLSLLAELLGNCVRRITG